ncbi:MAG: glycosyltransferase [Elusimicrobia bacterium]|nr:glycosyltransferase [Elusimicrobiota bacterium]
MTKNNTNMSKTKIFHLITSLNIGGTEKYLLTVLKNLKDKYDFSVGYLKERGLVADEIEELGIPVNKYNIFSLLKYLKENKVQIIHTYLYRANVLGRMIGKAAGVPVVISSQQSIDSWKKYYHVWLDKIASYFCDLIITNSLTAKNVLIEREKIPAKKIIVIYNGVFKPQNIKHKITNEFIVGCVTRLHREKGVYLIPDIAKIIIEKNKNIRFFIFGDGPEKQNLELGIKNLKLEDSVKFYGWQNDLEKIYTSFDLLLLPSEEESFPQAALDAMAFGIPVVASDVGGVFELVEDNKTGVLIKTRTVVLFADAILTIYEDKPLFKSFSENAKIKSMEYSLDKMINVVDNVYKSYIK